MSDSKLRSDFDACVTLYQDFIKQTTKSKPAATVSISEVKTSAGKRKPVEVEDRYYTKTEYDALSNDAKKALAAKGCKRGHTPGSKSSKVLKGKGKATDGRTTAEVLKKLKAVERSVAQLTKKAEPNDDESDDDDNEESWGAISPSKERIGHPTKEQTINRTHKALVRAKQRSAGSK